MAEQFEIHCDMELLLDGGMLADESVPAKVTFELERADPADRENPINTDDISNPRMWVLAGQEWKPVPGNIARALGFLPIDARKAEWLMSYVKGQYSDYWARERAHTAAERNRKEAA